MEMIYQCLPCIDTQIDNHHFSLSKYTLVTINDNLHQSLTPSMDVDDLSMMSYFNDYYKSTDLSESYGNQHSDQLSNSSSNSISNENI